MQALLDDPFTLVLRIAIRGRTALEYLISHVFRVQQGYFGKMNQVKKLG